MDQRRYSRLAMTLSICLLAGLLAAQTRDNRTGLYFPSGDSDWRSILPADAGWDGDKIDAALEFAGERRSSGVVILLRGEILAERYWEVAKPEPGAGLRNRRYVLMTRGEDPAGRVIEDVASAQKSVAAELVGIAAHRGLLRLDDSVTKHLGQGWSKASPEVEARITIRHLITMTSGLTDKLEFQAEPGFAWRYNTPAYARAMDVVAGAAKQDLNTLTRDWLTGPTGMSNSRWAERRLPGGRVAANPYGFTTTARDLARFGLLVLAGGDWNGVIILPDKDFLRASISPSQELNPAYGYLWWLNGQRFVLRGRRKVSGWLIPSAPEDLVAAQGALGRRLQVVPSLGLVVTRLGDDPNRKGEEPFDDGFWKRLMAAAPSAE